MGVELTLLLILVAVFVLAISLEINIGLVAMLAAYGAGVLLVDMNAGQIIEGFPDSIVLLLLGITLLVAVINANGAMEWLVGKLLHYTGGRLALLLWAIFFIAMITSAFGTSTAPILLVVGLSFAAKYGMNPLLIGALAVHGSQGGLFSPIAPYGILFSELSMTSGFSIDAMTLFFWVVVFHIALAVIAFFAFGGKRVAGLRITQDEIDGVIKDAGPLNRARAATLLGLAALVIGVAFFNMNIGLWAIVIATVLMMIGERKDRETAISKVPWNILLIIAGVLMYVNVAQEAKAFLWLIEQSQAIGSTKVVSLFLLYLSAAVTAVASTFATFGILIPMSAPIVESGAVEASAFMAAMAISAAYTDISPLSPWGAMVLASADPADRKALFPKMLKYAILLIATAPLVTWLLLVAFS